MDGTLVDSEKLWDVGLTELAQEYGGVLSADARRRMVGTNMIQSMTILHDDLGQPWRDPQTSVDLLEKRVKELFHTGIVWRPGAADLLARLRAVGVPMALVTATHRHLTEVALETIGAANFGAVVCGDDIDEAKPHPMPYLTAAATLGVDIRRCVAIEDSPNGIESALAAGAVVVAVPCEVDLSYLTGVTHVPSLAGLGLDFLDRLVASVVGDRPVGLDGHDR